jgi:transcriptional regulator with XRE-family HTH domain
MQPSELKALIEAAGLTLGQAAEHLYISRTTLWRWLNSTRTLGPRESAFVREKFPQKPVASSKRST